MEHVPRTVVPGFPSHPHRGFETITIPLRGFVDHFDSAGSTGRYGDGDVQWLTTGHGVQHSEMFPLLHTDAPNSLELFQLWLNLPKASKSAPPHFAMFWNETLPRLKYEDGTVNVSVVAGQLHGVMPLEPPPNSWAADPTNEVGVWIFELRPALGAPAEVTLPALVGVEVNRMLYAFDVPPGATLTVAPNRDACDRPKYRTAVRHMTAIQLNARVETRIVGKRSPTSGRADPVKVLVLQGRPISEPVVQRGPFVVNTEAELRATHQEYQATQFGGWPWPSPDHTHPRAVGRFAQRARDAAPEYPPPYPPSSSAARVSAEEL